MRQMLSKDYLYLDTASSTKINQEVLTTYNQLNEKYFANSSAIHQLGQEVADLENKACQQILKLLNVKNYQLLFTSGATESNNLAIKSIALKYQHLGKHLITSEIEHPSVINSFKFLQEHLGFEVSYLKVDASGKISLKDLKEKLRADTILVSIMAVNNELGTIINHLEWCKIVKENSRAFTHVDMVQALGKFDLDFDNVDLASFSAHKINGIKGSGFLLKRDYLEMIPLISGGQQQENLRAGTTNAPSNIVLAKTVRLTLEKQAQANKQLKKLNKYLYQKLKEIPEINLNSVQKESIYNIINFSIDKIESQITLNALNQKKIYVSAGSTCQKDLYLDSHVLKAIGKDQKAQRSRIRISLDESMTLSDMEYFVRVLKEIIKNYAI